MAEEDIDKELAETEEEISRLEATPTRPTRTELIRRRLEELPAIKEPVVPEVPVPVAPPIPVERELIDISLEASKIESLGKTLEDLKASRIITTDPKEREALGRNIESISRQITVSKDLIARAEAGEAFMPVRVFPGVPEVEVKDIVTQVKEQFGPRFKPVFAEGKLTGFEDLKERVSIPLPTFLEKGFVTTETFIPSIAAKNPITKELMTVRPGDAPLGWQVVLINPRTGEEIETTLQERLMLETQERAARKELKAKDWEQKLAEFLKEKAARVIGKERLTEIQRKAAETEARLRALPFFARRAEIPRPFAIGPEIIKLTDEFSTWLATKRPKGPKMFEEEFKKFVERPAILGMSPLEIAQRTKDIVDFALLMTIYGTVLKTGTAAKEVKVKKKMKQELVKLKKQTKKVPGKMTDKQAIGEFKRGFHTDRVRQVRKMFDKMKNWDREAKLEGLKSINAFLKESVGKEEGVKIIRDIFGISHKAIVSQGFVPKILPVPPTPPVARVFGVAVRRLPPELRMLPAVGVFVPPRPGEIRITPEVKFQIEQRQRMKLESAKVVKRIKASAEAESLRIKQALGIRLTPAQKTKVKQAEAVTSIQAVAQRIKQTQKQSQSSLLRQQQAQRQSQALMQKQRVLQQQRLQQQLKLRQQQALKQRQVQIQRQIARQKQITRQLQRVVRPRIIVPVMPPILPGVLARVRVPPVLKPKEMDAFQAFVKRSGKFKKVGKILPKPLALKLGARITKTTLAATFKVEPTGAKIKVKKLPKAFKPTPEHFRTFKIVKGKKIPLKDTFIEWKGKRLDTKTEVEEIKKLRRMMKK